MEIQILNWINENLHGSAFVNNIFKLITYLGEVGIIWLFTAVILLCFKKTRKGGFILLVGYGASVVCSHFILKNIINRPRPFTELSSLENFITGLGLEVTNTSSFPSTHTFISFCSATILTCFYKKKGAWSFIPATLISLSRIFLCVHYPTDVLAGMIIGGLTGIAVYFVTKWLLNKFFDYLAKRKKKSSKEDLLVSSNIESEDIEKNQEADLQEKENNLEELKEDNKEQ